MKSIKNLFRINDTPQKIALGLGLGVFLGIMPGVGPIAALGLVFIFRINRASALLGSLITNTWLSIVTFLLAIKVGAAILGLSWQKVYQECLVFFKQFHFLDLFKTSILKIILPLVLGYIILALALGFMVYLITLIILKQRQRRV